MEELPNEILDTILDFVPTYEDLGNLRLVSKLCNIYVSEYMLPKFDKIKNAPYTGILKNIAKDPKYTFVAYEIAASYNESKCSPFRSMLMDSWLQEMEIIYSATHSEVEIEPSTNPLYKVYF